MRDSERNIAITICNLVFSHGVFSISPLSAQGQNTTTRCEITKPKPRSRYLASWFRDLASSYRTILQPGIVKIA
ncbi:hypothetical protein DPMN_048365 [Dreissena polymorpha]|uniref:Uncharacterized protein n=1 Tax=Dreissena polymorpha TaxID=45954 RepID=A0A9D4I035_DREPO|nr:hypothetical protein DPMN_048365 [Dreissena polymorpha]